MNTKLKQEDLLRLFRLNLHQLALLQMLDKEKTYGLDLYKRYRDSSNKEISTGIVYNNLRRMKKQGLVKAGAHPVFAENFHQKGGNRRVFYEITELGRDVLSCLARN